MTILEAAEALSMSPAGVRRRIQRGEMKAERIGRLTLVIPMDEIERWKAIGKLKPGPRPRDDRP